MAGDDDIPRRTKPADFAKAIPVTSVEQEHLAVWANRCKHCDGPLRIAFQSLVIHTESGRPYDDIVAQCAECGEYEFFLFEVSAVFDQYASGDPEA